MPFKDRQRLLEYHRNYNKTHGKNRLLFKGKTIWLKTNPRVGVCSSCGFKGKTDIHHDKYNSQNPLANTRELCRKCHNKIPKNIIYSMSVEAVYMREYRSRKK